MPQPVIEANSSKQDAPLLPPGQPATQPSQPTIPRQQSGRPWLWGAALLMGAVAIGAVLMAWNTQQRVKALEVELVKRQQDSAGQANEARTLARQAELVAREAGARVALLDVRLAETTVQRSQLEELVQTLARSRDENILADIDNMLRTALQQSAITGNVEPLVLALRQAEESLARQNQPRLEQVRRAVSQDLDRVRAAGVSDLGVLTARLDELIRVVDELPLAAKPEPRGLRGDARPAVAASAVAPTVEPAASVASVALAASAASAASAPAQTNTDPSSTWGGGLGQRSRKLLSHVWADIKDLVRVTRIDNPEAMLVAPEQAWFLRENLKLRLLSARLALLSRQFDTAQLDLRDAQVTLDRYFDGSARRVRQSSELLKQVAGEARAVTVPRPDATLAAIATATATAAATAGR